VGFTSALLTVLGFLLYALFSSAAASSSWHAARHWLERAADGRLVGF
jgi:hypothetical protein